MSNNWDDKPTLSEIEKYLRGMSARTFERQYMQSPSIRADYQSIIAERSHQAQPERVHRRCLTCDELRDDCTCKNKTL